MSRHEPTVAEVCHLGDPDPPRKVRSIEEASEAYRRRENAIAAVLTTCGVVSLVVGALALVEVLNVCDWLF